MRHSEYIQLVQDFRVAANGYKPKFVSTIVQRGVAQTGGGVNVNAQVVNEYNAQTTIADTHVFVKTWSADSATFAAFNNVRLWDDETGCDGSLKACPTTVTELKNMQEGAYVSLPQQQLIAVMHNKYVPSELALLAKKQKLRVVAVGFERPESLPMRSNRGGAFYETSRTITDNDGDAYEMLHVLASQVGIEHISTSWPATVTFYANCMANCKSTFVDVSTSPDYTSIQEYGDGKIYSLTHFDNTPGVVYMSELVSKAGQLEALKSKPVDASNVKGIWKPAAGSVTPWGTHLGGESEEPDARLFTTANEFRGNLALENSIDYATATNQAASFSRFFGTHGYLKDRATTREIKAAGFDPYNYGFIWEAHVHDGSATIAKHYSMGRMSTEVAYTMPDHKTVYMADSRESGILTKFVAVAAGDLSEGELFCAKLTQASQANGAAIDSKFSVEWLSMGNASDASLHPQLSAGMSFDDIFDTAQVNSAWSEVSTCDINGGFVSVRTSSGHECLKIKEGMEAMASRFETRRYAAMLGCTSEFNALQGITASASKNKLFLAIGSVDRGMRNDYSQAGQDRGGHNHIKLLPNQCGCVFALDLAQHTLESLVCGVEQQPGTCYTQTLSHPNNVAMMEELDQLLISEASAPTQQSNNAMWVYDFYSMSLTRVFTAPAGAAVTSPYWHTDVTGTHASARKGNHYISLVSSDPTNQAAFVSAITLDNKVQADYSPVWAAVAQPETSANLSQHEPHASYMLGYGACPDEEGTAAPGRLPVFAGDSQRCHVKFEMQTLARSGATITGLHQPHKMGRIVTWFLSPGGLPVLRRTTTKKTFHPPRSTLPSSTTTAGYIRSRILQILLAGASALFTCPK
jgi:secreted PhoX family phosphatase